VTVFFFFLSETVYLGNDLLPPAEDAAVDDW
jgi:hypothetical protein